MAGDGAGATRTAMDALTVIRARRSIGRLTEPAPTGDDLQQILEAFVCAPDHDELRPWKVVLLSGAGMDAFGQVLADSYLARCHAIGAEPTDGQLNKERTKLRRAPLVAVVCALHRHDTKIPWIEQRLAVGAAVQNMLLAATALGYGSMWRTGDPCYDEAVKEALTLSEHDAIVGFVYLGTPHEGGAKPPKEPVLDGVVEEWRPSTS